MMQDKEQAAFDKWSDENMDYDNGLDAEAAWMECAKQKQEEIGVLRDALQEIIQSGGDVNIAYAALGNKTK